MVLKSQKSEWWGITLVWTCFWNVLCINIKFHRHILYFLLIWILNLRRCESRSNINSFCSWISNCSLLSLHYHEWMNKQIIHFGHDSFDRVCRFTQFFITWGDDFKPWQSSFSNYSNYLHYNFFIWIWHSINFCKILLFKRL